MNYYTPNYYPNYGYMQPPQQSQLPMKIVDGEDMVKAAEIPIGGYGIFPKADLSEIYVKSWNSNGTTSIITFKPTENENKIIDKLNMLDSKIDNLLNAETAFKGKKEAKVSDY